MRGAYREVARRGRKAMSGKGPSLTIEVGDEGDDKDKSKDKKKPKSKDKGNSGSGY